MNQTKSRSDETDKSGSRGTETQTVVAATRCCVAIVMVGAVAMSIYLLGLGQEPDGWIQASSDAGHFESASVASASQYICPMMCTPPSSEPGRCPVCGMEFVPSTKGGGHSDCTA